MPTDELINLMQVRAFVRVVDLGSVSRACETLFRAQSVVTRAISELEVRLAVPLFERHANGMRLTNQGAHILPRARRVLAELDTVPRLLGSAENVEPLYLFQARRLQVFAKLCESRHMQTVASHFGLSQPAVSAALKVLEGGAGRSLFERTPRGLQPTRASLEIVFPIRRALNELRHIDTDLSALRGSLQGVVQVGALPLGRTRILPEAIVRLTAEHPGIHVITNESPFDLLATELRAGDVDFIFGALRGSSYASDLSGEALWSEDMVVLARREHPLRGQPLSDETLADAGWVLPRAGSPARQLVDDSFSAQGLAPPRPRVESADLAIIRGLLLRSDMLAIVSAHQLEHEIERDELCILPLSLARTTRAIGLTCRTASLHSPLAQALMATIRQVVAELPAQSSLNG
ncbi:MULTISPECIES: LysR family transcriptional regulator [unclassified Pseudomonas]|uniref:LysR family transcriptional regulator n=1 Tax=unclassified Pseudomonas TaxID=196821 RepID=UPI0021C69B29|nr:MULTISPECIES: LysR family transcriptional regulator [unclassified Pseudomonas]MCU1731947.1 LysR family transcriptional regulator [Pseudomonas sp. 20P_3.2_Bac4]MCU1744963.1 LysR family transcriptional regulator [Pseudomonas sp. 20P_3.2_Bac5]